MTTTRNVIAKALQYCQPSNKEIKKLITTANKAKKLVDTHIYSKLPSSKVVDVVFGGSFAKGTWLKGHADVDIFMKMNPSISNLEFEQLGRQIGLISLKKYRPYLRYSAHPYVEARIGGIRINVVPCYDVQKGKWKSAADRSPFHTDYIISNLDDKKKEEVRLLKKFLQCMGTYGSEIATNGFSGYVTEVLILKYGSFESVLQTLSNIQKDKNVISIDKVDEDVIKTFQNHNIIIIDPIDPRRNLGTAISAENIGRFILAARAFLKKPSMNFFKEKTRVKKYRILKDLYSNLIIIEFKYKKRSPDIIWGQLKRSLRAISKQFELAGYKVIRDACITNHKNSAAFVFLLESVTLSPYFEKYGPDVFRKDTDRFISKNKKKSHLMWINKEMKVVTLVQRRTTDAKEYIKILLTGKIEYIGITKGLLKDIENTVQVYGGNEQKINALVKNVVNKILTTESLIFQ